MISINPYEIIFQIINFSILYLLMKRFLSAPLATFLAKRKANIQNQIETAELNRKKSEESLHQQKEALKAAQVDAQAIRKRAEESAKKELSDIIEKGKKTAEKLHEQARQDIDIQTKNATKTLLTNVADLTVKVVEKFVGNNVTDDQKEQVIHPLIDRVSVSHERS